MLCIIIVGKILTDEQPLTEYNIDEKKFIVVMVSKPKNGASTSDEAQTETDNNTKSKEQTAPTPTPAAPVKTAAPVPATTEAVR